MSDIVERLRQPWPPSCSEDPLMTEAADTITILRAEVEDLGNRLHHVHRLWANNEHALRAENERLRAALIPFACRCARKGEGAGGTCLAPGGVCSSWNARAALEGKL